MGNGDSKGITVGAILLEKRHEFMSSGVDASRPLTGYRKSDGSHRGYTNGPGGWSLQWLVVTKTEGGVTKKLYEQPMIFEDLGVFVVLVTPDGEVGLVENHRNIGDRPFPMMGNGMIASVEEQMLWPDVVDGLGRMTYEMPMGIVRIPSSNADDPVKYLTEQGAINITRRETGLVIRDMQLVSRNANAHPTFVPYGQPVVLAEVDPELTNFDPTPDDRMVVGGVEFFDQDRLRELIQTELLVDLKTMGCLGMCGLMPSLLQRNR